MIYALLPFCVVVGVFNYLKTEISVLIKRHKEDKEIRKFLKR